MSNVESELQGPGILTLTIAREERRNALNRETLDELEAAFQGVGEQHEVRVVVLRGAGERAFCAGADLGELLEQEGVHANREHFNAVARVILAMHRARVPVISRVQGFALAGGCGLAVAADFTVAGESAVFGLPEIGIGLLPMVVSAPIYRATGSRKAVLDLVLTGRRVAASEALSLGLASRVVPDAELDATVSGLAEKLASLSPAIVQLGKRAVYQMSEMSYTAALDYLRETVVLAAQSDDAKEGISSFFEKREPQWTGS